MGIVNKGGSSMVQERESELVKKIKAGNEAAFKAMYDRYQKKLRHYAFLITKSQFYADDILQRAFMEIWMERERLKPELSFNHYLFKITRNLALKHLRKVARDQNLFQKQLEHIQTTTNNTQDTITFKEYQRLLDDIILTLPPRKKSVYNLSRREGKNNREIAEQLGISEKTVKNTLTEAVKTVKEKLWKAAEITVSFLLMLFVS